MTSMCYRTHDLQQGFHEGERGEDGDAVVDSLEDPHLGRQDAAPAVTVAELCQQTADVLGTHHLNIELWTKSVYFSD